MRQELLRPLNEPARNRRGAAGDNKNMTAAQGAVRALCSTQEVPCMQCKPFVILAAVTLALASACNSPSASFQCDTNAQCPAGMVCSSGTCLKLCAQDTECVPGDYCNGTYCQTGQRSAPEITSVVGLGCDGAGCLGRGFRVTGHNLSGSSLRLDPESGGASVPLVTVAVSDTAVDVTPVAPETVSEGRYRLVAVNAAGEDQSTVELLRGEAGPPGPPGPEGPSGPAGPPGAQLQQTYYEDQSPVQIRSVDRDRLVLKINADDSSEFAMPVVRAVDDAKLLALCGDEDGCTISIGITHWHSLIVEPVRMPIDAPDFTEGCRFAINPVSRRWVVARPCDDYSQYNKFGEDGLEEFQGEADNLVVMAFRHACYFAESPPNLVVNNEVELDINPGFYFFTGSRAWSTQFPTAGLPWKGAHNSPFACTLVIEG